MASTKNSSPPVDLAARISGRLGQFVRRGDRLVAALSGGADSVLLLHVLGRLSAVLGFHLSALHVNHGISPNSDHWQSFCEQLCREWGIRIDVKRVIVERGRGESLEAAARRVRYDVFAQADADWLVLAHHRGDQAETILFNLLRGAGVSGAAAMPMARDFPDRPGLGVLRPLLDVSRGEIEACASSEGLSWIEDESNADVRHSRNFLRHQVFPILQERFPGCEAAFARAATHFAEGERLLEDLALIDAEKTLHQGRIIASELAKLGSARARNLMRYVLRRDGVALPDSARLHEIVRQVCHAAADRQLNFCLGDRVLHRYRDEVWLIPAREAGLNVEWRGEKLLKWGGAVLHFKTMKGAGISLAKLARGCVKVASRRGGERFRPDRRRPHKELRKLLQEHGMPPWERDWIPLLWCGDELVWVSGIGIDCAWQCAPGEPGILPEIQSSSFQA